MAKLNYSHETIQKRNCGRTVVEQTLDIEVDYDEKENSFNVENVRLYENGKFVAEIAWLLEKAPGNPLDTILGTIDWSEVYLDYKEEQQERFSKLPSFNMADFANDLLKSVKP